MTTNNTPGAGAPTGPPGWTTGHQQTSRFGNTVAPGSGVSGMSEGLHTAVYDYVQGTEFGGVLTSQWGLYTPMYLGLGQRLPAQASPGQVAFCLVDAASSVVWQFVYFGATQQGQAQGTGFTGYPWIFVGGAPMRSDVQANEPTSSVSFTDLATVGPQITLPFSGDYDATLRLLRCSTE
jgi:hypothetical protein